MPSTCGDGRNARSDSNRRPSHYESQRTRPAGASPAGSRCSRPRGRPSSALLTGDVTAGGMTSVATTGCRIGAYPCEPDRKDGSPPRIRLQIASHAPNRLVAGGTEAGGAAASAPGRCANRGTRGRSIRRLCSRLSRSWWKDDRGVSDTSQGNLSEDIFVRVSEFAYRHVGSDTTGHDFYHLDRVGRLASRLAVAENANPYIAELAGRVHDLCRPLERQTGEPHWGPAALAIIADELHQVGVEEGTIKQVLICVGEHERYQFLGDEGPSTIESAILQDADRLDALGAIGIARTCMYTAMHSGPLYIPGEEQRPWNPSDVQKSSVVNHYSAKLRHLEKGMHTRTAKILARERTAFMHSYFECLRSECNF
jgi:uncharacterized protein